MRATRKDLVGGNDYHIEGVGRASQSPMATTRTPWAGKAVFYEFGSCPPVYDLYITSECRATRQVPTPKDPMPEVRELHSLTHLPLLSWCNIYLRAKCA